MTENRRDDVTRAPQEMSFQGLLYVKMGRIGSRSEGPDYFLQTAKAEIPLEYDERQLWMPDYHLEFFNRRMVKITGSFNDKIFAVKVIEEILSPNLPQPARIQLALGGSTQVDDLTIGLSEVTDSRCPTGAVCIRAGEAIASLWAQRGPAERVERFELTLEVGRPELATKEVAGARFTLTAVEPYPTAGTTVDPRQRIVRLEVEDF